MWITGRLGRAQYFQTQADSVIDDDWAIPPFNKDITMSKKTESPPPKTSPHVRHTAGKELRQGNKTARELAGSVERHIEPRETPKKKDRR
jgi:hypothetical protein